MEISSVKSELESSGLFSKNALPKNLKLYSIHPLFGSIANPFAVNTLIQIGRDSGFVRGIFPHYRIFEMSVRDHDRLMATMLTLPHMHALSFADSVARKKIPEDIHGPSYDYLLELSKRMLRENERVYYEIQATNPYAGQGTSGDIELCSKATQVNEGRICVQEVFQGNWTRNYLESCFFPASSIDFLGAFIPVHISNDLAPCSASIRSPSIDLILGLARVPQNT